MTNHLTCGRWRECLSAKSLNPEADALRAGRVWSINCELRMAPGTRPPGDAQADHAQAGDAQATAATTEKLHSQLAEPHALDASAGLTFCAELTSLAQSLDYQSVVDSSTVAELFQTAAELCPPTLASRMHAALETAVRGYTAAVSDPQLTSLHVALATLCAEHHLSSELLELYTGSSTILPPLTGPGPYFSNCSIVHLSAGSWDRAALDAALALAQEPSATRWRMLTLCELIAYGETIDLPRGVSSSERCPLTAELATYFATQDAATGSALRRFCADNETAFKGYGVWHLVQRACITFYVAWLCNIGHYLTTIPWDTLAPILHPISIAELRAAGLEKWFSIAEQDGEILLSFRGVQRDDERALSLITETSMLAAKLPCDQHRY